MVNLTATEAKVELLTSEFMQLRPDPTQGGLGAEDAQDDYFMFDDDDNYQYEVTNALGKGSAATGHSQLGNGILSVPCL